MPSLEDNFTDILRKAQRGLRLSHAQLSAHAGVSPGDLDWVLEGQFEEKTLRKLAPVLHLGADALVTIAGGKWWPQNLGALDGLAVFESLFGEVKVNSFLVWDTAARAAVAFDTGTDCDELLGELTGRGLTLHSIFITHAHGDHVYELARLKAVTGATAFVSEREPLDGAESFAAGKLFSVGRLQIETRSTTGHSRGGTTYVVTGLARRLAVVGDAMFAGSVGGGLVSYDDALRTNREQILSLPDDTVICPGHGPLTTVGEQKKFNPFFPEFQS
jgi:glyoxylase-like metal-dependent hydrolase (beta-lactamase superfamily II)